MAEFDFHFTAEVMDGIFGEVIEARGAWDSLGERLDNIEGGVSGDVYTKTEVDTMLAEKVDVESGKGLSTNDFTNADKSQIAANAAVGKVLANSGAKNILKNSTGTQTVGGVTFTVNADGSITANGIKTNNDWYFLSTGNALKAGTYVLSSGVESTSMYVVIATSYSMSAAIMTTSTATGVYTRELTQDYDNLIYGIRISNGTVCDNVTFKPMLCEKSLYDEDASYQPYAPTNRKLYEMILALQSGT